MRTCFGIENIALLTKYLFVVLNKITTKRVKQKKKKEDGGGQDGHLCMQVRFAAFKYLLVLLCWSF